MSSDVLMDAAELYSSGDKLGAYKHLYDDLYMRYIEAKEEMVILESLMAKTQLTIYKYTEEAANVE